MTVSNLATALSVIFVVFLVALTAEFIYVLWCRRSFRRHSSPPPIHGGEEDNPNLSIDATKELFYFFCLKPHTRVDPIGARPDDEVVDVFKLLEANGPSKFLCTIKEEDKEHVESTPDVDFSNNLTTKNASLQFQLPEQVAAAEEDEVIVTVIEGEDGETKTVFSTPCDSPLFFTPAGSPGRDFMETEFVVSVHETGNSDDR